jgi:hypothetical protein
MRTLGHHPTRTDVQIFTIYMDSINIARRVLIRKYLLKIGYQPITSTVFDRTPWHHSLLPAPVRSARMLVQQDSVYKYVSNQFRFPTEAASPVPRGFRSTRNRLQTLLIYLSCSYPS